MSEKKDLLCTNCEDLKAKVVELQQSLAAQQNVGVEATGKIAELEEENTLLNDINKELTAKVEELSKPKTIVEAGNKAAKTASSKLPSETFEVDGRKYRFICPVFIYKKNRVVAAEAINNEDLLAEMVGAGIGAIKEV